MANELEKNTETNGNESKKQDVDTAELEAKIKALESERDKLKQSVTNASADASEWKKKYQSKLSEEEAAKEKQEEANATLQKELEDLRAERNVANHKAQLISMGFEDALAVETAQALNSGDTAKVFDALRKFITTHDKQLKENAFRQNPTLPGGGHEGKAITKEQFDKMGYTERLKVFNEHHDLYKEFTS